MVGAAMYTVPSEPTIIAEYKPQAEEGSGCMCLPACSAYISQ